MSLAEMHKKPKLALSFSTTTSSTGPFIDDYGKHKPRFRCEDFAEQMEGGGLPVPAFVRDRQTRSAYWNNWIDTTLARDAAKAYGKGFDAEYCSGLKLSLSIARHYLLNELFCFNEYQISHLPKSTLRVKEGP